MEKLPTTEAVFFFKVLGYLLPRNVAEVRKVINNAGPNVDGEMLLMALQDNSVRILICTETLIVEFRDYIPVEKRVFTAS